MADTALRSETYDLVLLDLGLPKRDGLDVLRALRARHSTVPVLVATARDAVGDRVAGLDAGADDYVVKPYDTEELLARIRALIRRSAGRGEPVFSHKGVKLNPATREAAVNGSRCRCRRANGPCWSRCCAARRGVLARPARREAVRLEGRHQQQRGRGVHPRPAQEARAASLIQTVRGLGYVVPRE